MGSGIGKALWRRGLRLQWRGDARGPRGPVDLSMVPATAWLARQVALITHAHPLGIEGAVIQACAITLLLQHPADEPLDVRDSWA